MKVNKKTIYSSIEITEEEKNFCKTLLEIARDLDGSVPQNLYDIITSLKEDGHINFKDDGWY